MFQPFSEWQRECVKNAGAKDIFLCPECEGEGTTLQECDCCGHERGGPQNSDSVVRWRATH